LIDAMYRGKITPDEAVRQWREMQAQAAAPQTPAAPSGPVVLGPPFETRVASEAVAAEDLTSGFQDLVSERFPYGENQLAASKGYPGIGRTAEGVPDFAGSGYLFPTGEGQSNIVRINLTGTDADVDLANAAGGYADKPAGYTWHHLDYDSITGEGTMQLVQRDAHEATFPHAGGMAQYWTYRR
jgi:hypothetical protein